MATRYQITRDTNENLIASTNIIEQGVLVLNLTNNEIKIGTGLATWNELPVFANANTAGEVAEMKEDIVVIKESLDNKINKDIAGAGNKIVQDLTFTMDEITGETSWRKNLLDLATGEQEESTGEINFVSEDQLGHEINLREEGDKSNSDNLKLAVTNLEAAIGDVHTEVVTLNDSLAIVAKSGSYNDLTDLPSNNSTWGTISGNIEDQEDLQTAFEAEYNRATAVEASLENKKLDHNITYETTTGIKSQGIAYNAVDPDTGIGSTTLFTTLHNDDHIAVNTGYDFINRPGATEPEPYLELSIVNTKGKSTPKVHLMITKDGIYQTIDEGLSVGYDDAHKLAVKGDIDSKISEIPVIPTAPTEEGTYSLMASVASDGTVTYNWMSIA